MKRAVWLLAAALTGCAAAPVSPASDLDPVRAARELTRLSARVDRLRARLGLPPPVASALPPSSAPESAPPESAPPPMSAESSRAAPPPSAPPPLVDSSPSASPRSPPPAAPVPAAAMPTATERPSRPSSRCRKIAAAAAEICHAGERICVLARQLGEDDTRCAATREDCRRAQELAESCQ